MRKFSLLLFVFYFVVLFNFGPVIPPKAFGANDYIDVISLYKDADGYLKLKFKVKTSFTMSVGEQRTVYSDARWIYDYSGMPSGNIVVNGTNLTFNTYYPAGSPPYYEYGNRMKTFTAGNTYSVFVMFDGATWVNTDLDNNRVCLSYNGCSVPEWNLDFFYFVSSLDNQDYITDLYIAGQHDTEDYYFSEYPSLSLTFPATDGTAEIAGDFNITGTVTQPSPYKYNKIRASFSFYSEWGKNTWIGEYLSDLTSTSTQDFTLPVMGLPVSNPNYIEVLIQLLEVDSKGTVLSSYGTTANPWNFIFKTMPESGAWVPPANFPDWPKYFDISSPSPSNDGYYHLTPPTSSVEFIYNFPDTYKVWIYQDTPDKVKLATSTFASLDPDMDKRFVVNNFDATSTPSYIYAKITNGVTNDVIINAMFPVIQTSEGEVQNVGLWNDIFNFISRTLSTLFVPSPAVINTITTGYKNTFNSKIPFSYFRDIYDVFAPTTVGVATSIPLISYSIGGVPFAFSIFDIPTEITETQGWKTMYQFLRYGCYLVFVYYIIDRVRGITVEGSD